MTATPVRRYGYVRRDVPPDGDRSMSLHERTEARLAETYGHDRLSLDSQLPGSRYRPDFQVALPPTRLVVETVDSRDQLDSAVGQTLKYSRVDRAYLAVLAVPEALADEASRRVPDSIALITA